MMVIVVSSEQEKQELLEESRYIHYLKEIDSDKANTLMHLYMNPDMIQVNEFLGHIDNAGF